MNILISNNARYYMYGNKVYDALLDETFHKDEISLEYWINLLRENTIASYTHGIKSIDELRAEVKDLRGDMNKGKGVIYFVLFLGTIATALASFFQFKS